MSVAIDGRPLDNRPAAGDLLAVLNFRGREQQSTRRLVDGEEILIGSDDNADIQLACPDVSSMHCIVGGRRGLVVVRDCYSATGTFVDGVRVSELQLSSSATIRVGSVTISVVLHSVNEQSTHPLYSPNAGRNSVNSRPLQNTFNSVSADELNELKIQLSEANAELEVLRERMSFTAQDATSSEDSFRDEMIELLRNEVLELQAALAMHSQSTSPAVLPSRVSPEPDNADILTTAEAQRLIERLETLLQELTQRDEHIALLTGLLQSAEEANRAEQEERKQLNQWVSGIEKRIGLREQEWQAERNQLKENIQSLELARNRAEVIAASDTDSARMEAIQKVLSAIREENTSLRQQLAEAESRCEVLRKELQDNPQADLRDEAIRLSQERAELARLRHDLEVSRTTNGKPNESTDANLKFRALRQHLQDMHEQEQKSKSEVKLGGRIARLWSLLDRKS